MGRLLFVTLDVPIVTLVTLSCHPDVTVFCSSFFPPTPHFCEQRFLSCCRCAFLRPFSFSSIEEGESRKTKQTEENDCRCRCFVPPSLSSISLVSFTGFHLHFDSSLQSPPLSPVAVNTVVIAVIAAFVLKSPSKRSVPESGMCVPFFLAENSPAHGCSLFILVRESFLLLRTSLPSEAI